MPEVGDDDVLIRVHAAAIGAAAWHLMSGLPYLVRISGYGLTKPKIRTPGTDVSGRVEAVGKNVSRFQPGDEIFGECEGSLAEYACAPEGKLMSKPARLTFEHVGPGLRSVDTRSPSNRPERLSIRVTRPSWESGTLGRFGQVRRC